MSLFDHQSAQLQSPYYGQSAVGQFASKASLFSLPTQFLTSPAFWAKFLEVTAQATEKASPNYTTAHKVAAVIDHLLTGSSISTPDAHHAENVTQAIGEAVKALVPTIVLTAKP